MTEINERHVEWATVARMRDMLKSVRRDYEVTQTYTLFSGILCWVMQRVRWKDDSTALAARIHGLRHELEKTQVGELVRFSRSAPVEVGRTQPVRFNDFSEFEAARVPLNTLLILVALRNAVAHADARRVEPINQARKLVGYRIICASEPRGWRASVALDRHGMAAIADEVARRFCEALIDPKDHASVAVANELREAG